MTSKTAILKEIKYQMTGGWEMVLKTPSKILKLLILNLNMAPPELAKEIGKTESTTKRSVHRLKQLGYLNISVQTKADIGKF